MQIKVKTWIEDKDNNLIFGGGKTQILEYIDKTGSIAKASSIMGINYKKAWSHVQILQNYIEDDIVISNKGRKIGGTVLTPKAKQIIKNYKILKEDINFFAQKRFNELFLSNTALMKATRDKDV